MTNFKKGDRVRRVSSEHPPEAPFNGMPFVLVKPAGPQWSDVEPGDKVKVRLRATKEEFETSAYYQGHAYAMVLGLGTMAPTLHERFELLSIEKPKPVPPTAPGSVVLIHSHSKSWPNGLPLLRQGHGVWIGQDGQLWSDTDVAYANGGTFEVLHDAGQK